MDRVGKYYALPVSNILYARIHFQISGASFESKLFPRAAALGERLWTNPTTGFYEAEPRMTQQNHRMMMRGIQADAIQVTFYLSINDLFLNLIYIS